MTDATPDTAPVDLQLLTVLKQMVADITNPDSHYIVSASYINFIDGKRSYTRLYMCPIYVHQDSASNIDFDEQGVLLDTFFSPEPGTPAERIRIPYERSDAPADLPHFYERDRRALHGRRCSVPGNEPV